MKPTFLYYFDDSTFPNAVNSRVLVWKNIVSPSSVRAVTCLPRDSAEKLHSMMEYPSLLYGFRVKERHLSPTT